MNKFLRGVILTGIFILPFAVLIVSNSMFFPFITGKNFFFRFVVEIIGALWIILALRDSAYRPKLNALTWSGIAFLGLIFIADLLSPNVIKSFMSNFERMEGWVTLAHLFVYFLAAASVIKTQKIWDYVMQTVVAVSSIISIYGFLQLAGKIVINQGGVRLDATFGNATYLAIFMLFSIFLAGLSLIRRYREARSPFPVSKVLANSFYWVLGFAAFDLIWFYMVKAIPKPGSMLALFIFMSVVLLIALISLRKKPMALIGFNLVALLTGLAILYRTETRGAALGLLGGVIVASLIVAIWGKAHRTGRQVAIGIIVVLLFGIIGIASIKNSQFVKNHSALNRLSSISLSEGQKARFPIWGMAIQGFKERPIFGWGQESFNYVFNKYYNPKIYSQEQWFDRTHNIFFDWLVSGGLLGLLAYLALYVSALYLIWRRNYGEFNLPVMDRAILTGLLVGHIINNFFVFDNIGSYILFFTILGYASAVSDGAGPTVNVANKTMDPGLRDRIIAPAVIVVMFVAMYFSVIKGTQVSGTLIDALRLNGQGKQAEALKSFEKALAYDSFASSEIREQLAQASFNVANSGADLAVKTKYFELTKSELLKQLEKTPNDARYQLFTGSFFTRFKNYDDAIVHLNNAQKLSPAKQSISFELALAYIQKGEPDKGLDVLKKAYELDTAYEDALKIYAVGAIYAKRFDLVKQLLVPKYGTVVLDDDRFINAYSAIGDYQKVLEIWKMRNISNPNNPQVHISLAATYLKLGMRSEGISELRKAIELNPAFKNQGEYYIGEIQAGRNP